MQIIIETDEKFNPHTTKISVNGKEYKGVKNITLKVLDSGKGSIAIEHESGYLEAYQGK